jgi:atypical dual specificity phosphatase/dual specificity phosphatase 3
VDLTADDYYGTGVKYLGFTLWDSPLCSILPFLGVAADFIHRALEAEGKVMVCCQMGVSRSAACVLAYLMVYR